MMDRRLHDSDGSRGCRVTLSKNIPEKNRLFVSFHIWLNHLEHVQTTFSSTTLSDSTPENEMAIQDTISRVLQTLQIH